MNEIDKEIDAMLDNDEKPKKVDRRKETSKLNMQKAREREEGEEGE